MMAFLSACRRCLCCCKMGCNSRVLTTSPLTRRKSDVISRFSSKSLIASPTEALFGENTTRSFLNPEYGEVHFEFLQR